MRWCSHIASLLLGYIAATASAAPSQTHAARQSTEILPSYDYVVVGSGPGGGPLAARLAIAGKKVLLIEAGDDQGTSIPYQVPALSLQSTEYEPMRWDYFVQHLSDPEEQTRDSKMTYRLPSGELHVGLDRPTGAEPLGILYPRAGTLGGCGSHNALITIYPHRSDWDGIAALTGDSSRKYHLDLGLNTLATKVRFDQSGPKPRAVGVDFITGQSLYRADPRSGSSGEGAAGSVNATAEVIVSAGAFNTPQLLKLSGVGPKDELASFGIPVIVDLPGVGTNLQDRYEATIIGETPTDFQIIQGCTFFRPGTDDPCLKRWQDGAANGQRGVYGSNGIAIGIVKKSSTADGDPDLFLVGAPVSFSGYYPGYAAAGTADARHWTWLTLKAHSRNSAGTVRLRSADPRDVPQIDFNSFRDADAGAGDIQAVVEGMRLSRRMLDAVVPLSGGFTEVWPGRNVTDEMLPGFVRNEAWGHHASCTCPIGKDGDAMAVLDSEFRVRGTEGLRVVDASVFPKIPGYFIAAPVYMVSEKAADVILGV
ncbi:GMC oxidoreductase [Colletotrichum falcatum]|nr:GMC oxidoreductase [Colletotrichum falcatum]